MMRNILYGRTPKTLAEAFMVAQTVYYDNQHMQLEPNQKFQPKQNPTKNYPNKQQQPQMSPAGCNPNPNGNQPKNKMESMEGNGFKKAKNWPNHNQKINQIHYDESNPNEGYEGDICDDIPDDLVSNTSDAETTLSSAFLDA